MKETRASIRYAKAMLAFAEEASSSQAVNDDMKLLMSLMTKNLDLNELIENPMIGADRKEAVMNAILPKASKEIKKLFTLFTISDSAGGRVFISSFQ